MKRITILAAIAVVSISAFSQNQNTAQPGCVSRAPGQGGPGGAAATSSLAPEAAEALKQARQSVTDGKFDDAIASYRKAQQAAPNSPQPFLGAGTALDLKGDYDAARKEFAKAIDVAQGQAQGQAKIGAWKSMAISYAFTSQGKDAEKYEKMAFDQQTAAPYYYDAGETADELARIYLEAGDASNALKWYRIGYENGIKEPNISAACRDLWEFRWENAQARVAARQGKKDEAQKHVAAAKAVIDRGTNPDQAVFVPYLAGYVDYFLGDYKTALADLQKANQRDPFILLLEAQSYEKTGDSTQATELYRKILAFNTHNPPNAFARPVAEKKLNTTSR